MVSAGAHVGLIGYGAIGADLHERLEREGRHVTVMLRPGSAARSALPARLRVVATADELIAARPDCVVEAAGQAALGDIAPALLRAGITVVAASTGALADPESFAALEAAARSGGGRLVVPAGSLGGLDYLAALRGTGSVTVRYTSRKPPGAWRAELAARGHEPSDLPGEIVLFEGAPAEAARLFPRNLNAGLTVALAAPGAAVTVRVIADPGVTLNTHEVEAASSLGTAFMRFANEPSPANPKTSAVTAASLAAAVRRLFEPIVA